MNAYVRKSAKRTAPPYARDTATCISAVSEDIYLLLFQRCCAPTFREIDSISHTSHSVCGSAFISERRRRVSFMYVHHHDIAPFGTDACGDSHSDLYVFLLHCQYPFTYIHISLSEIALCVLPLGCCMSQPLVKLFLVTVRFFLLLWFNALRIISLGFVGRLGLKDIVLYLLLINPYLRI